MRQVQGATAAAATLSDRQPRALLEDLFGQVAGCFGRRETRQAAGQYRGRQDHPETVSYLQAKEPYLDYPSALASGWPIAIGVIEGACRHLVNDRMGITGARWGLDGAQAIL